MIEIGIAGKPNAGKSTFFKAATLADAEIANYPFTTIKPNVGIGYVRVKCVCQELGVKCNECIDGWRFIPVKLIDVAGLVPDAHKGRGLGNEFLDNLRQSEAVIHVVDASGSTDEEGNEIGLGERNPVEDVRFLYHEIDMWLFGILKRNWDKIIRRMKAEKRDPAKFLTEQLAGLGFEEWMVREAMRGFDVSALSDEELKSFAVELRKRRMQMVIAANKADKAPRKMLEELMKLDEIVVPTSAAYELILRTAAKNGYIKYLPGDSDFEIIKELNEKQVKALEKIREFLKEFRSTGVQEAINRAVFDLLDYIVVYPVEDENKFTDSKGNVLPDAMLVKRGTTAKELAFKIHTDIGKHFIYALDAKTKMRVADDYELKNNDVIKIVSGAK
ncbi:MAG: redox-regulated ATPase YchF [Archaeoglobus sp.]|uniref:redox-regulated ATPase YchF n=1 Tax=Archaeoglobus sp. TaxID=1872626 RepID=UPI001D803096|nr:redox-regulated ATPase YchF [Archaeoglobus sp.]MBO8179109.1 redox-regulated ATPase YchF [Archaeoglobus sp.]